MWTRAYREQIQLAVRAGLEPEVSKLQVQRSNRSATLPPSSEHISLASFPVASSFSSPSSSSSSGQDYFSNMPKAADVFDFVVTKKNEAIFFPFLIIYVKCHCFGLNVRHLKSNAGECVCRMCWSFSSDSEDLLRKTSARGFLAEIVSVIPLFGHKTSITIIRGEFKRLTLQLSVACFTAIT